MGWLGHRPPVATDDDVLWSVAATRRQTAMRLAFGRQFVTKRRNIFQPNRFGVLYRWTTWSASSSGISEVGTFRRSLVTSLFLDGDRLQPGPSQTGRRER